MKTKKEIPESLKKQILHLAVHGYGSRKISLRASISRSLVRRVLEEVSPEERKANGANGSKLSAYSEIIDQKVLSGLTTTRILREIKDLGYSGGRTVLAELVARIRLDNGITKKPSIKRRFETVMAAEMQVDWSPYNVNINGKMVKIHILGVISGFSRKLFFAAFRNERQNTLLEGLSMAFEYFEGCALRVIFDNMTTAVLGRCGSDRQVIWNGALLDFSRHYAFTPFACSVRDPDRKGKQEKSFRLLEDDFIKGSSFASWDDLNSRLRTWLDQTAGVCNNRVHGTTGKVPNEEHLVEKSLFIRLPHERFPVYKDELRVADRDATISVEGIRYTIPAGYGNRNVVVRLYARHFEVFEKRGAIIFTSKYLDRTVSPARLVIDQTHYADLSRKPRNGEGYPGMQRDFIRRFPKLAELVDGIKLRYKALVSIQLSALVRLAGDYGDEALLDAGLYALHHKRFSADSVRKILESRFPEKPDQLILPLDGRGAVMLGEVEESSLDEFAHLDSDENKESPK